MPNVDPITGWFVREKTDNTRLTYTSQYVNVYRPKIYTHTVDLPTDSRITWSGQGRKTWHACEHRVTRRLAEGGKCECIITGSQGVVSSGWTNYLLSGQTPQDNASDYPSTIEKIIGSYPSPDANLDWGKARDSIFQDITGRLPVDVSVPLNVIEFGQLKRLVPSMAKSIRKILNLAKGHRSSRIYRARYRDNVTLGSMRWGLKDLSSSYLAVTFGLRPLIDDVTNWMTKYYQVKMHNDWFRRHADGKMHVFRASTPGVSAQDETEGQVDFRGYGRFGNELVPCRLITKVESTGVLGAKATIWPKSSMAQASATIASILGLNAPLSTAWEIIPFSFVADWFFPIGEAIRRADNSLFGGSAQLAQRFELNDCWSSIRSTVTKQLVIPEYTAKRYAYGWTWSYNFEHAVSEEIQTTYNRYGGWPAINLLPTMNNSWSIARSLTSAALVLQRVFR